MKRILTLLLTAAGVAAPALQANAEEVYRDTHVRFTLIDEGTLRLEYAPDGRFVDDKSFVAVVRNSADVPHTLRQTSRQVTITTSRLKLVYKKGDGPLTDKNLSIAYDVPASASASAVRGTWRPGMQQSANLKGTYRTLDGYSGSRNIWDGSAIPLEDGLLARDGWTLLDDSDGLLFSTESDGWDWVKTRPSADAQQGSAPQDLYFMAYGHNYKDALRSYTRFAGDVPLPPRYAFGYWWSRYWSYSDQDFRTLIDNFHRLNIPLDVLVIDMDWHPISPEAGGGWTGWDWNEGLFPDYRQFLAYLDEQGVKTTMNLHPADGVRPYEHKYTEFLQRYGRDANAMAHLRQKEAPDGAVEWLGSDKQMVSALFDTYLHPYMDEGVDFWWLDWQQWLNDKQLPQLSNTWWCNYLFFSDMERHGAKRPMLYHRWGGLGNHRYQIGFSGDALMTWESLDYLPYFNSTASNVLYGYWSHDIGGHWNREQGRGVDAEMYTRAMQMGQYLPILRSHSTKDASLNKEPWAFDATTQQRIVATINGRYALVPYIYTMARQAHETGLSLCRPLYYDSPEAPEAYDYRNEYMFGDNLLVAPITHPVDTAGFATLDVWLPEGQWVDPGSGEVFYAPTGGCTFTRRYTLDEYPLFVRAGSILPYYGAGLSNLGGNDQSIILRVFPGADGGSFTLYEDNGDDNRYRTEYATTPLRYEHSANGLTVTIGRRQGHYDGMPARRHYSLALPAELAPAAVTLDGRPLTYTFDATAMETLIDLGHVDCTAGATVTITFPDDSRADLAREALNGMKGTCSRILTAVADYKQRNAGLVYTPDFAELEATALRLHYQPEQMHNAADEARFKRMLGLEE